MWPVPVEPPANTISLVEDKLTVNNAQICYIEPEAELVTGWKGMDDSMGLGIDPGQPIVWDLEWGTDYTIRVYSNLNETIGLREFYEIPVSVPQRPRPNLIVDAYRAYISAYNRIRDLAPTAQELFQALVDTQTDLQQ